MNEKTLSWKGLIWLYLVEYFNPSEGVKIPVAPSGNILYVGPPLRIRVERRLRGYYLKNPKKCYFKDNYLRSIDDYFT